MAKIDEQSEVLIIGGGLVGLTLGQALASGGLSVAVIDREDPATVQSAAFDGRASAIAAGSQRMLAAVGLWAGMAPHAEPILDIRVSEGRVGRPALPYFLHYDHAELGEGPLGFIVENRMIRRALHARLPDIAALRLFAPARVTALRRDGAAALIELEDGRRFRGALALAADGRNSPVRAAAGIRTMSWDYPQVGIVGTLAHELPHGGVAHEHFLPSGPFAVLPMTDAADGTHRSSLVWTERKALAPAIMALDDEAFGAELERRFGNSLGRLRGIGGRWCYPLSLLLAERSVLPRLALVGDAAHAIHPIAGQGLNLGLRDVAALAETLVDAHRLGLDFGSLSVLERYQRWRRFDNLLLTAMTDGLNRLFSNDIAPLSLARGLGLAAVNRVAPLKRFFMRHAMGLSGELPRLIRGQPL
jgi:2-octaprenyl-6-methoxyphenol hydroxylase